MEERREKLFAELHMADIEYIERYYGPKERQFLQCYTKKLANLGCGSTQRNEGFHPQVKAVTHRTKPLQDAVRGIRDFCKCFVAEYYHRVNKSRTKLHRQLDRGAFSLIQTALSHPALIKVVDEWAATKKIGAAITNGDTEAAKSMVNSMNESGCQSECSLPLQYGLPCRHWLYHTVYLTGQSIPPTLFHPRWVLDPRQLVDASWTMGAEIQAKPREYMLPGDRYRNQGQDMMLDLTNMLMAKWESLEASAKEPFAHYVREWAEKTVSGQNQLDQRNQRVPRQVDQETEKAAKRVRKEQSSELNRAEERLAADEGVEAIGGGVEGVGGVGEDADGGDIGGEEGAGATLDVIEVALRVDPRAEIAQNST